MNLIDRRIHARTNPLSCWRRPVWIALFMAWASLPATTVVAPAFERLVSQSDYIVRAVVKSVSSELKDDGQNRHIITKVALEVKETISGTPPQPLVLLMVGGKVGEEEMVIEGAPKFQVGDEDILFVSGNGRKMNPLVALMHGRYPIKRDAAGREYVARSNGAPLHSEREVSQPISEKMVAPGSSAPAPPMARSAAPALSPADFVARIKATVIQNSRPKLEN